MYFCQITGKMSKVGEKLRKVVVATRQREYKNFFYNEESRRMEESQSSFGTEIVKELNASEDGEAFFLAMNDEDRAAWIKRFVK
jgi:hypothetical protein